MSLFTQKEFLDHFGIENRSIRSEFDFQYHGVGNMLTGSYMWCFGNLKCRSFPDQEFLERNLKRVGYPTDKTDTIICYHVFTPLGYKAPACAVYYEVYFLSEADLKKVIKLQHFF